MSKTSNRKGKAGERELANLLADLTGWPVARRVRQHEGDSDLVGVLSWAITVRRRRTASRSDIANWWQQACDQAGTQVPVLFYRLDRRDWRAVWPLGALLIGAADWGGYQWTVEGSVEAWAAVARDLHAAQAMGRH